MNGLVNHNPFTPIVPLLSGRGPTTILWRVRAIIVYSVERMSPGWFTSHVTQKGLKAFLPSLTHLDAACAVVFEGWVVRVIASSLYRFPSIVFDSARGTVSRASFGDKFFLQTSAASCKSPSDGTSNDGFLISAIATAQDEKSYASCAPWLPVSTGLLQHGQPSEAFPDHRFGGSSSGSLGHGSSPCLWSEPLRRLPVSAARCFAELSMDSPDLYKVEMASA